MYAHKHTHTHIHTRIIYIHTHTYIHTNHHLFAAVTAGILRYSCSYGHLALKHHPEGPRCIASTVQNLVSVCTFVLVNACCTKPCHPYARLASSLRCYTLAGYGLTH